MKLLALLALCIAGLAQTAAPTGSVSGRVFDADSGAPIRDFPVGQNVRTDGDGRYKLTGLKPGPQSIRLFGERFFPELANTPVTVEAGKELTGVDFHIRLDGEIYGRVLDESKDPVANIPVHLIGREYYAGALRTFTESRSTTNDRGEYVFRNIRAGRSMLLLVETAKDYRVPISDAPSDPKLRRSSYRSTYYPNADSASTASAIRLRSGEQRRQMDIQVLRSPSYCVEALLTVDGAPAGINFKVTDEQTSSANMVPGTASSGGRGVSSGPDGKIRVCDLAPGQYRIAAYRGSELFGSTSVTVSKEDVRDVRVLAAAPATFSGDASWDGTPPDPAIAAQFTLIPRAITNDAMPGRGGVRSNVPGPFSFTGLQTVEYTVQSGITPANALPHAYVKDITYGTTSILYQTLRAGGGADAHLRLTLANDGGLIKANAVDANGAPAGGIEILILPAAVPSEAVLAEAMKTGQSDTTGAYTSGVLAPGKYFVLATTDLIDKTPECIHAVWQARNRGQEVDVNPNATVSVTLRGATALPPPDRL